MNLEGFLKFHKKNANGLVTTDRGKELSDAELRAYCQWGVKNGYKRLSELPEFEIIEELNNLYKTGDKIKFVEEKRPYKIRACNERFLVCTKPFNPKHTVMYTIVDLKENVRGTESLIFCMGFETDEECKEALERLISGETEVSYRNRIQLNIVNNG